jgi:hypothetical protein
MDKITDKRDKGIRSGIEVVGAWVGVEEVNRSSIIDRTNHETPSDRVPAQTQRFV